MKPIRPVLGTAALAALLTLAACFGPPSPAPSPSSASASTTASSAPASPSPTASSSTTASGGPAPSSSAASSPAQTAPPTAPGQPTQAPAPPASSAPAAGGQLPEQTAPLTLYYIAIGDGGVSGPSVGCGDSAVATYTAPVTFRDQVGPSLTRLFANRSREIGESGLVNVLYQSTLKYLGGSFDGTTITVYLSGSFFLGGVCDIPRAEAQINLTAITAAGAKRAAVFVNGRPMAEVLSLK
ncbi:hypothetical protein ACLMMA_05400 [Micrococcus luteus]